MVFALNSDVYNSLDRRGNSIFRDISVDSHLNAKCRENKTEPFKFPITKPSAVAKAFCKPVVVSIALPISTEFVVGTVNGVVVVVVDVIDVDGMVEVSLISSMVCSSVSSAMAVEDDKFDGLTSTFSEVAASSSS